MDYLTELTHRRPRIWIRDVDRLHTLLATYGDDAVRIALTRGLEAHAIGAEYIAHYLATGVTLADRGGGCRSGGHPIVGPGASSRLVVAQRAAATRPAVGKCQSGAARRPGPGRRRRPPGRSAAEGLDAAEHGASIFCRRRATTIELGDGQLDALLKRLHLANTRRAWRDLTHQAEEQEWSYRDFLALLVTEEIAQRQQTRIARMVRRAHFPFLKTIDDSIFMYQSTVRLSLLGSALAPDFVTEGRWLIFGGKPGRGKTHLAVAIAYRAIQNGFDARVVTAAELIDDLSAAFRGGRLAEALGTYIHPSVLVVDEVG